MQGWNPSLSSFNSKFHLPYTEVSVQGAPVPLACWVGIPVYLVLINCTIPLLFTEVLVQGASVSLTCWVGIPSLTRFNSKFHLSWTEVSVQEAPVSLACWVGIPFYLVLIVCCSYHTLKYQSRELLSPLLAGLET